jgi:peptide-methionine (S)-S-oxide reductase
MAAAEHLLSRGATLTLGVALCLERWEDAERLAADASPEVRQFAVVLAALNGKAAAVTWMVDRGALVNEPSADLYAHGTPLHHAVCSGSLETVKVLTNAGADIHRADSAWNATPLGWAEYYEQISNPQAKAAYAAIASYLRELP